MWLPETAVDLESLEVLAAAGHPVYGLVPVPGQPGPPLIGTEWHDVSGGRIDPSMAYLLRLPSGPTIILFFYDGPISRAVAFENLLDRGENLANRLREHFPTTATGRNWCTSPPTAKPTAIIIARRYGAGLRPALHRVQQPRPADELRRISGATPADAGSRDLENSSWSCVHGVERWRSNCGCNSGGHPELEPGMARAAPRGAGLAAGPARAEFEIRGAEIFNDPWLARDSYIDVILDRSAAASTAFCGLTRPGSFRGRADHRAASCWNCSAMPC